MVLSYLFSQTNRSDGSTAAALAVLNLFLFAIIVVRARERALACLLLAALGVGMVELIADFLCVRMTRTLDYSVARSALVLESPWWMPLSWTVVALQLGTLGAGGLSRWGVRRGMVVFGGISALVIPFYEEMAHGAHWWRYQGCWLVGHTPVYIIVAEALIGAVLALLGYRVLREDPPPKTAVVWGLGAGLSTIVGGMVGWGLVEFLGRGARPSWPF